MGEELLLARRVDHLVNRRLAQRRLVHRLELEEQVELQPLGPVGGGRVVRRVGHGALHRAAHLLSGHAGERVEHLQRVQQQRLEEQHARRVPMFVTG